VDIAGRAVGAVLCGGASRRMGRDKALVEVDGVALARRVADALRAGGCPSVLAIGGDAAALAALGLEPVPDRWPGEGPLGGLATALAATSAVGGDRLVLAPCDLLHPSPVAVAALLDGLDDDVAAVAVRVGERVQWLPSAWRLTAGLADRVAGLVDEGARRLDAVALVVRHRVLALAPAAVADADTPPDLPPATR
jgi:molybdenum cofactor guanylyltransferase